jgi:hypothetical protein
LLSKPNSRAIVEVGIIEIFTLDWRKYEYITTMLPTIGVTRSNKLDAGIG